MGFIITNPYWSYNMIDYNNYKKALFISFSDNGTPYDFDNKVFIDAKEALIAYRKFKKISKYKLMIWKVWAVPCSFHHGFTWIDRT